MGKGWRWKGGGRKARKKGEKKRRNLESDRARGVVISVQIARVRIRDGRVETERNGGQTVAGLWIALTRARDGYSRAREEGGKEGERKRKDGGTK